LISLASAGVMLQMGLRNLVVHRVKTGLVGGLLFMGTFLVVFGTALLDSVEGSMERSITSSLAGNAQVYSAQAKDPLTLFPAGSTGTLDYGEIDDFPRVREALLTVGNVHEVVPMGITTGIVFGVPQIDRAIESLRDAVDLGDSDGVALYGGHIRAIADGLRGDVEISVPIADDPDEVRAQLAHLDRVASEAFWRDFDADPAAGLDFLDTRIAPLAMDGRLLYLRLLGTDLDEFRHSFDSFQLVDGTLPPSGEPGLLLAKRYYERQIKDKVARDLDEVRESLEVGETIAASPTVKLLTDRMPRQVQGLLYQLTPEDAEQVRERLSAELGVQGDLRTVLSALLTLDDANFARHYALFYEVVAPRIRLYETPVGEEIVVRSFTKSGYQRAVSVKVYGTFRFSGLEGSDLAAASNLVDMGTFRSLYGRMTAAQQQELAGIRASVGLQDLSRATAEDALFGGGGVAPAPAPASVISTAPTSNTTLALNAAVILEDASLTDTTIEAMQARLDAEGLGLRVVDWQAASGLVGQLLLVLRVVLTLAVIIIFIVALVIITNTLVMTTMDRTTEIGTMRAIGAQRGFVVWLFVVETLALGVFAGGLGAASASALILWLGQVGVPAVADILVLVFAGRHLYPQVAPANVGLGLASILVISLAATLYPAFLATRVPPVVAMQGKE
jgi:ABC-type lipoprotein release transport system permease subunit